MQLGPLVLFVNQQPIPKTTQVLRSYLIPFINDNGEGPAGPS